MRGPQSPTLRSGPTFGRRRGASDPEWSADQVPTPPHPPVERRRIRALLRAGRRLVALAAFGAAAAGVLLWALQPVLDLHPVGAVTAAAGGQPARAAGGLDLQSALVGGVMPGTARAAASTLRQLPVAVVNASGRAGEARRAASDLRRLGFRKAPLANLEGRVTRSAVVYGPGWRDRAVVLGQMLEIRVIPRGRWLTALPGQPLVLLLGRDAL